MKEKIIKKNRAFHKIVQCINSSTTPLHLTVCAKMRENFLNLFATVKDVQEDYKKLREIHFDKYSEL